jgi:hypothetical protein
MIEWSKRCRGVAVASVLAVAIALSGCLLSTGAASATHMAPLPEVSLTPRGWSPVSLAGVQISVPSGWFIEDPGYTCGGGVHGLVSINQTPALPPSDTGCPLPPNTVELSTPASTALSNSHRIVINSISATERAIGSGSTATEVVHALGVDVEALGPSRSASSCDAHVLSAIGRAQLLGQLRPRRLAPPGLWGNSIRRPWAVET